MLQKISCELSNIFSDIETNITAKKLFVYALSKRKDFSKFSALTDSKNLLTRIVDYLISNEIVKFTYFADLIVLDESKKKQNPSNEILLIYRFNSLPDSDSGKTFQTELSITIPQDKPEISTLAHIFPAIKLHEAEATKNFNIHFTQNS